MVMWVEGDVKGADKKVVNGVRSQKRCEIMVIVNNVDIYIYIYILPYKKLMQAMEWLNYI